MNAVGIRPEKCPHGKESFLRQIADGGQPIVGEKPVQHPLRHVLILCFGVSWIVHRHFELIAVALAPHHIYISFFVLVLQVVMSCGCLLIYACAQLYVLCKRGSSHENVMLYLLLFAQIACLVFFCITL